MKLQEFDTLNTKLFNNMQYFDFVTKPFIESHMTKGHNVLHDFKCIINKVGDVTLFGIDNVFDFIDLFDTIRLMAITKDNLNDLKKMGFEINATKCRSPFLIINKSFFEFKGKQFKKIRRCCEKFSNETVIMKDDLNSIQEFDDFLKMWKIQRARAHFQMFIGYDKEFLKENVPKWKSNLITRFFYINNVLVGYAIVEKIKNGYYNYLYGKALTSYPGLCLYIDVKMFEIIYSIENDTFIINMGSDSGERGMFRYKTKSFPVEQIVFENYDGKILSNFLKESV